jgi:dephospho-CoA kinase
MYVIGLTGGIGTGKSEVSGILRGLGAVVLDADIVGHEAYKPHSEIWLEILAIFGDGVLQPNGEIDRKALGAVVFGNTEARVKLNSIMHPRMAKIIENRIGEFRSQDVNVVVLEAALLLEAGWQHLVDEIWTTTAPEELVIDRVRVRSNLSTSDIVSRIRAQMPIDERLIHSDVVVENVGGLGELRSQVEALWKEMAIKRVS